MASPAPSPAPTVAPAPPPSAPAAAATCPPVASGGAPPSANGPYFHQVLRAASADGLTFQKEGRLLLDHASVPDAVLRPDGQVWLYYVNGQPGQHGVWAARVTSGGPLEVKGCVLLDGRYNPNMVDPDVVRLPDGRYRIFYYDGQFVGPRPPPGQPEPPHPIYSALSTDGLHFTVEGRLLALDGVTDPSAIRLSDGRWLMALSQGQRTLLAASGDGVSFALTGVVVDLGGVPELATLPDGRIRLFVTGRGGIQSLVSADGGATWTEEPGARLSGDGRLVADPSALLMPDGSWTLYYKTVATAGQPAAAPPPAQQPAPPPSAAAPGSGAAQQPGQPPPGPRAPGPGAPVDRLSSVPACPELSQPLFSSLPMALSDFLAFRPLGWTSPPIHVFPAKHSNFALALPGQTPPVREVRSPGAVWLTEINFTEWIGLNKTGYGVTFYPCKDFKAYFGHLSRLSDRLMEELKTGEVSCRDPYSTGGVMARPCKKDVSLKLEPGEVVGYSGDAAGVDFGAIDYRAPPMTVAIPAHYSNELLHYVSPILYFTPETRALLESKIGSYDGTVRRTAEPLVGTAGEDIPGTAQGNWFTPGLHWGLTPPPQPDPFIALVHEYVDSTVPIFSVGTSVKGLAVGVYTFTPRNDGKVNRDFKDVRPDGSVYCYEGFKVGRTPGGIGVGDPQGVILIAMPDANTLLVEKQGAQGSTCASMGVWTMTANATRFER